MRLTLESPVGELGQRLFQALEPVVPGVVVSAEVNRVGVVLPRVDQQRTRALVEILRKIRLEF